MTQQSYNLHFDKWDLKLVEHSDKAMQALAEHKLELYNIAYAVSEQYFADWKEINESLPWKQRGKLGVRVRKRKRDQQLTIQWLCFWYEGEKGARKRRTDEIAKGNGFRQNANKLRGLGLKDWELELFREYEPLFAQVRQRSSDVQKLIFLLQKRLSRKYDGEYIDYSFGGQATEDEAEDETEEGAEEYE